MANQIANSVYFLVDPRNNEIFYVGSSMNPEKRLKQHIATRNYVVHSSLTPTQLRIIEIHDSGNRPFVQIVATHGDYYEARAMEELWMRFLIDKGYYITNQYSAAYLGDFYDIRRKSEKNMNNPTP